jgi:3-oxo-5-alpha-steroid 4-dehydrogenase 1
MLMGVLFNVLNGFMQGEWIFYLSPSEQYNASWFTSPMFIVGTIIFFAGMAINLHSDNVIRHLRKPGDTRHYLPSRGLYRYVTSANYFGEIVEWGGWALLTCSWSGLVFFWWTFANLVPRANAIYGRYRQEFGEAVGSRKRVFPFIY